ncbi:uncharacterized protein SPSK_06507 [Sporothrix schenckii 1099-18]|uniref:Oxidase ustYa n=2 Tax=Sporothrix schenckii TaxID=29908 RepID=U7PSQ5_SPOS1|nr:uncharacterized protein SPSK_06507 [Sporothrix schenckii 1099-18]ERS98678.1 hypothetical protein HMPREF1624_05465 [Sporothrix schenckii ATCC 58251]KJR89133.1 hypothetical protein SPSK_06507 [Sporothrix schenckii 1099-18]
MNAKYESVGRPANHHDDDLDDEDLDLELDLALGRHSSSSTEVDESLLGGKNNKLGGTSEDKLDRRLARQQQRALQRRRRSVRACIGTWARWGLDTILLLAILGLVARQQTMSSSSACAGAGPGRLLDFGGDFTGVGPRVSQQITRFTSDPSYAPMNTSEFFTEAVLQKWNHLMPVGMGFVWVNDTHRYHDLPTPIDWPDKTVFTTSVTHQIHCLFTIAQTYSGLTSGHPIPPDHHWHMIHCMDYMREAILCSSDMALEGHETTFPDDNGGSDGWDSKHVCKDYREVKAYLESVRAYDDQLIY